MPDKRGRCPACRSSVKLRRDGTVGAHVAKQAGSLATYCIGAGMQPELFGDHRERS